jgi:hypothetical protein
LGGASDVKSRFATVGNPTPSPNRKTSATAEGGTTKGRFYWPLPKEFRWKGFQYRQIAREGDAAIYEQTWNGCRNPSIAYEVVRIRRREGFQVGGRLVDAAEIYPNSEAWGTDGFTFTDKDAAFARLGEVYK